MNPPVKSCWKVIHKIGDAEHVYLAGAETAKLAKEFVCDKLECGDRRKCTMNVALFVPDEPYFLYAFNRVTGEMSPENAIGGPTTCVVCLGNTP